MTILVVDVSTVTTESKPEDRVRLRAPEVRASRMTPGVVSTDWTEVAAPEGPVEVVVEPGELEIQLLSKRPGPKLRVIVPDVERIELRDLMVVPDPESEDEKHALWYELQRIRDDLQSIPRSSGGGAGRSYGHGPPPEVIPGAEPGHEYVDMDTMELYILN